MTHINLEPFDILGRSWRTETFISMPPTVNKFETFSYPHNDKQESCPAGEPPPWQIGEVSVWWLIITITAAGCFLSPSSCLDQLPLPSMALSQFAFHIQGLISQNVTELTYKRETVLETFVISPQHTETYISKAQRPGAARVFIWLSSALVPCRAAQIHQSQTTHLCHQT